MFKPVIFAEPGTGTATGLLPGDRLLKVNDVLVEHLPREAVIEMIRQSEDSVVVEVIFNYLKVNINCKCNYVLFKFFRFNLWQN